MRSAVSMRFRVASARKPRAVWLGIVAGITIATVAHADEPTGAPGSPSVGAVPPPPAGVAAKQRLSGEDYARKVDGGYVTGVPLFAYDPNLGFGFGARLYYYYDGHRDDPLFAYTPYRHRVFAQAFATTGGARTTSLTTTRRRSRTPTTVFARRSSSRPPRTGPISAPEPAAWRRCRSRERRGRHSPR